MMPMVMMVVVAVVPIVPTVTGSSVVGVTVTRTLVKAVVQPVTAVVDTGSVWSTWSVTIKSGQARAY